MVPTEMRPKSLRLSRNGHQPQVAESLVSAKKVYPLTLLSQWLAQSILRETGTNNLHCQSLKKMWSESETSQFEGETSRTG